MTHLHGVSKSSGKSLPLRMGLCSFILILGVLAVTTGCPPKPEPPSLSVTPLSLTAPCFGGSTQPWQVATEASWSASSDQAWAVAGPASGTGNGSLTVACEPNPDAAERTALITIAGNGTDPGSVQYTVTQPGGCYEPWEPDTSTFDVEFAQDVVQVPEDRLDLLLGSDTENHVYTFDKGGVLAAGLNLTEGSPLVIPTVDIRRIVSVDEVGDTLVVETEFIPLNEVITNGVIEWDYGVEFTAEKIKSVEVPGYGAIATKDGTPIEFSLEIGGLTYEIKATLDNELATFEFTVTKGVGDAVKGKFVATGQIRRFRSKDRIAFEDSELREFGHELNGMQGEVTLELVVAASGNDFINLELPATIMRVPFLVGMIPMELDVKVQFVINASVPIDGSSRVKTKFTYDSDLGLSCDGVTVSAGGHVGSMEFGKDTNETGASGAISANFGLGFPRVELSILGDSVVPWAQTAFLIGGSYTFTPPCQKADALFLGALGYKLGLFGLDLLSGSKTLFTEEMELLRAGDCPEDAKNADIDETAAFLQEPFAESVAEPGQN